MKYIKEITKIDIQSVKLSFRVKGLKELEVSGVGDRERKQNILVPRPKKKKKLYVVEARARTKSQLSLPGNQKTCHLDPPPTAIKRSHS